MQSLYQMFTQFRLGDVLEALLLLVIGYMAAKTITKIFDKTLSGRLSLQQAMLLRRITFYLVFVLFLASAIQQLGFNIAALLGATGIITIAIGIASQTSLSNVISGIFIIGEKPFQIGDNIKVNSTEGEVISIDYLSVKIRTPDHLMVRVPNEILIKSSITNLSYFSIRRSDFIFGVAYNTDLDLVKKIFLAVAEKNAFCLTEPKPLFLIQGIVDSNINIQFAMWSMQKDITNLKNSLFTELKKEFIENNIEIPYPSRTIYAAKDTGPLHVNVISEKNQD
jgi:small-conductance mechanosensitive channel